MWWPPCRFILEMKISLYNSSQRLSSQISRWWYNWYHCLQSTSSKWEGLAIVWNERFTSIRNGCSKEKYGMISRSFCPWRMLVNLSFQTIAKPSHLEWKVHKHTEWMFQGKVWHDISFLLSMTSTITAPWQPFAKKHANELDRIHPNLLFIVSIFSLNNVRLVGKGCSWPSNNQMSHLDFF